MTTGSLILEQMYEDKRHGRGRPPGLGPAQEQLDRVPDTQAIDRHDHALNPLHRRREAVALRSAAPWWSTKPARRNLQFGKPLCRRIPSRTDRAACPGSPLPAAFFRRVRAVASRPTVNSTG